MRPAIIAGGLSLLIVWAAAATSTGQTISAPSQLPANSSLPPAGAPGGAYTAPSGTTVAPPAATFAPPNSTYVPGGGATTAPGSPYAPGGYGSPPPSATLQGTITPWDPYATPGAQMPPMVSEGPAYGEFAAEGAPATRALQKMGMKYLWMAGQSGNELGINDLELYATFALPFFYNTQTPILVTPGFAVHYWNGPKSGGYDLPPQTYDAYLDMAWNPQVTQRFGGELGFRVGIYSDFGKVDASSFRYQGRGLAVLTLSDAFKVKFGVWYIDRNAVKILPSGGVVWTPSSDVRFEILFPNPKLAQRLTTFGTTEWWWYVRGEYGGGAWSIRRDPAGGAAGIMDKFDYNDIRVALGLEFNAMSGLEGHLEVGLAFDREVYYVSRVPGPYFKPNNTMFIGAGLSY